MLLGQERPLPLSKPTSACHFETKFKYIFFPLFSAKLEGRLLLTSSSVGRRGRIGTLREDVFSPSTTTSATTTETTSWSIHAEKYKITSFALKIQEEDHKRTQKMTVRWRLE